MIFLNLVLMIFNLLPIPPLDGSSLLPFILPRNSPLLMTIERQGFLILFGLILADIVFGGRILSTLVGLPVETLARFLIRQ
jgi:Zn-dependent protease